jgi:hypothetical protein
MPNVLISRKKCQGCPALSINPRQLTLACGDSGTREYCNGLNRLKIRWVLPYTIHPSGELITI